MKLLLTGLWAVCVTLAAGYGVASWKMQDGQEAERPRLEGLRYTSLPTMSVPVLEGGRVVGYVVVRLVYTADAGVLRALASEPDPFITDEIFRTLYNNSRVRFGQLARLDLGALADTARRNVNSRMGDDVVQDLLVDGLNYVDLTDPDAAAIARGAAPPGGPAGASVTPPRLAAGG